MKNRVLLLLFAALLLAAGCHKEEMPVETVDTTKYPEPPTHSTELFKREMLARVNELRKSGCDCGSKYMAPTHKVTWSLYLEDAAFRHAEDMNKWDYFNHISRDGRTPGDRITEAGYAWRAYGENIALNQTSIEEVVEDWKNSPSHCEVMMSSSFTEMGAALVDGYWVQNFAKPYQ